MGEISYILIFMPVHGGPKIAMTQQAESQERQSHLLRKEDPPDIGWYVCKGIPDTADDEIFKRGRLLDERRPSFISDQVTLADELVR